MEDIRREENTKPKKYAHSVQKQNQQQQTCTASYIEKSMK